ncbi:MAG: HAD-IIB family hydrolase [Candidatus Woesearchaeota archaeon]
MKKIIMLDIDGTLYDYKYGVNTLKLKDYFKKDKKNVYVLNSNRSYEDIKIVEDEFGLNSIIVAENVCLVYNKGKEYILTNNKQSEEYIDLIKSIISNSYPKSKILILDTVDIIKNSKKLEDEIYFFINKFRKYSFSIHVKRVKDTELIKELSIIKNITQSFKENKELNENFSIKSSNFGNIIFNPKDCDKATGLEFIRKNFYPKSTFICIGDDLFDLVLAKKFDYFFAVNNAEKEVKEKADGVSKDNYTLGVYDILTNLDKYIQGAI